MVRTAWILLALLTAPIHLVAQDLLPSAKFYIYRYSMLQGIALHPAVYCDGKEVVHMQSGRVFEMNVPPGEHSCYMKDGRSGALVNAEAGKEHYFRVFIQPGTFKGIYRLDMVMPEQGKFDVQKLKPSS